MANFKLYNFALVKLVSVYQRAQKLDKKLADQSESLKVGCTRQPTFKKLDKPEKKLDKNPTLKS